MQNIDRISQSQPNLRLQLGHGEDNPAQDCRHRPYQRYVKLSPILRQSDNVIFSLYATVHLSSNSVCTILPTSNPRVCVKLILAKALLLSVRLSPCRLYLDFSTSLRLAPPEHPEPFALQATPPQPAVSPKSPSLIVQPSVSFCVPTRLLFLIHLQ